jgi:hypothetical protein
MLAAIEWPCNNMNRRTILKSIVAAPAAAVLRAQTATKERAVDESPKVETAPPDAAAEPVARFFSHDQFAALSRLCETFEPSTSLPGAREGHAAEFLDFLLSQSPAPRQALYRNGLDRLNSDSAHRYKQPFATLDTQQAAAILEPLRRPWTYEDPSDAFEHFLREAKSDVMEATRNSYEFITAASKGNRRAAGVGEFWYPLY